MASDAPELYGYSGMEAQEGMYLWQFFHKASRIQSSLMVPTVVQLFKGIPEKSCVMG